MANYLMLCTGPALVPDPQYQEEYERRFKKGEYYNMSAKHERGSRFHRKFFALMNLGYNNWNPGNAFFSKTLGVPITKSFDAFRKDIIIAAGYHTATYGLDGSIKLVAHSISFNRMDQAEFEKLYNACVQVLIDFVFAHGTDPEEVDKMVEEIARF